MVPTLPWGDALEYGSCDGDQTSCRHDDQTTWAVVPTPPWESIRFLRVSLIFGLVWSPLKTFVVLIRNQASQLAYSWEDDEYKLSIL